MPRAIPDYEACRPVGGWAGGWLHPAGRQAPDQKRPVEGPARWEPQRTSAAKAHARCSENPGTAVVTMTAFLWVPRMRCTSRSCNRERPTRRARRMRVTRRRDAAGLAIFEIPRREFDRIRYDPLAAYGCGDRTF